MNYVISLYVIIFNLIGSLGHMDSECGDGC
jgi:hypothetical protein